MIKDKNKTVVLQGNWGEYSFKPHSQKASLRKFSKFSLVYKGISSEGEAVVVKVLPEDTARDLHVLESFKNEIEWFGKHPNILAPYEYIFHENKHYLISEYLHAIDLGYYCRYRRVFRKRRIRIAIDCGIQLLDAVETLHKKGVIHADIKPANVMFLTNKQKFANYSNPIFKLIDFGMVRAAGSPPPPSNKKTQRPFVLGYSPPEQVLGFHELVGVPSDLYNIALLIYEMVAKEPAYSSNLSVKLMNLQTSFPLQHNKSIPAELMHILFKAASKHHFKKPPNHYKRDAVYHRLKLGIEQRYQNTAEFKDALLTFRRNFFKESL